MPAVYTKQLHPTSISSHVPVPPVPPVPAPLDKPNPKGMRHPRLYFPVKGAPPAGLNRLGLHGMRGIVPARLRSQPPPGRSIRKRPRLSPVSPSPLPPASSGVSFPGVKRAVNDCIRVVFCSGDGVLDFLSISTLLLLVDTGSGFSISTTNKPSSPRTTSALLLKTGRRP